MLASCGGNQVNSSSDPGLSVPLSAAEKAGLIYMREEEELARDLYMSIFSNKGLTQFQTISQNSETVHASKMLGLLNTYNVADPSTGQPGIYSDPSLQILYGQLAGTATGATSTALSAYQVGALVEEVDIIDIENYKAQVLSAHQLILSTYDNLLCGSRNHLRAFASQISAITGQPYQAQNASLTAVVNTIVTTPNEKCGP